MNEPISNNAEFLQCLRFLLQFEESAAKSFLLLPEDRLSQNILTLRKAIRDYLNQDQWLG